MTRVRLLLCCVLLPCACTQVVRGPDADLAALAAPAPVEEPVRLVPHPVPGPTPAPGSLRAWVPRHTTVNGDVIEGHWLQISLTPPPVEMVEPVKPIPHVPRGHVAAKPRPPQITQPQAPQPLLPVVQGALPYTPAPGVGYAPAPTNAMPQGYMLQRPAYPGGQ